MYIGTYKPGYAVKPSAKSFGFEEGKKTVPNNHNWHKVKSQTDYRERNTLNPV